MAFGWSAGDIFTAIKFIIDVASALDDISGARKEFRQSATFLRNLDKSLSPLRTFTALDAQPEYKADIEEEVDAIRRPIETFMTDVEGMAKKLGTGLEPGAAGSSRGVDKGGGRFSAFKAFRHVGSKLEWHYFTSKKAMALQKDIEGHLRIIDTLMQRLTIDMLHQLQANMKGDIQETIESSLNTHLSPFKSAITAELSQHNDLSRATWVGQLEEILERYLGSQRAVLTPSPGPPRYTPNHSRNPSPTPTPTKYTTEMIKRDVAHLQSLLIPVHEIDIPLSTDGVTADLEITHRLRLWLASEESEILWIQGNTVDSQINTPSIAIDTVAAARAANVSVLWYKCQRLDASGNEISQTRLFLDLLVSLLHQLLQSTPCDFLNDVGALVPGFESMDASSDSIRTALDLLAEIMVYGTTQPDHRIVVIDGLDLLGYSSDNLLEDHTKDLLDRLRAPLGEAPTKTLITTTDQTTLLLDIIGQENVIDASQFSGLNGFIPFAEFGEK
ncbi:hypothetical protein V8E51_006199 [Hyaloscypha variabilis]